MSWTRNTAFALCLTAMLLCAAGVASAQSARVLLIGNSYLSYKGGVARYLAGMTVAAAPADDHAYSFTAKTIGDSQLDQHDVAAYLAAETPPGVTLTILQGHSTSAEDDQKRARFRTAARAISQVIRSAGADVALYMTPAYRPPHQSFDPGQLDRLETLYRSVGAEIGAPVIPVGLAFAEAYRQRPEIGLHNAHDGSHPTVAGSFLAAATVYASLYGRPPPVGAYAGGRIPPETARFLLAVAADTAATFFKSDPLATN